jgi:hypothetical protein
VLGERIGVLRELAGRGDEGDLSVGKGLRGGAALAEAGAPRVGQARLRRRAPLWVHLPADGKFKDRDS